MTTKYYAGIGSRSTPIPMCKHITDIARMMAGRDYVLRSGGAEGADKAFEAGALSKEIFTYREATPEAIEMASKFHPAWHMCNPHARQLHGRNVMIILGKDLKTPVNAVFCFTIDEANGGTALGLRVARAHNIPVYNLYHMSIAEIEKLKAS